MEGEGQENVCAPHAVRGWSGGTERPTETRPSPELGHVDPEAQDLGKACNEELSAGDRIAGANTVQTQAAHPSPATTSILETHAADITLRNNTLVSSEHRNIK